MLPADDKVTTSLPDVALVPDQEPEAEHEVALLDDQVKVNGLETKTKFWSADNETVGTGSAEVRGGLVLPPPQETRINIQQRAIISLHFRCIKSLCMRKKIFIGRLVLVWLAN